MLELDLNRGVRHQKRVRDCHLDALYVLLVLLICVLVGVWDNWLLLWRNSILKIDILRGYYLVYVHMNNNMVLLVLQWIVIVVSTWTTTC